MRYLKTIAVWLLILPCAIGNGAFREAVLLPRFGMSGAYLLSGVLLSVIIIGIAIVFAAWMRLDDSKRSLTTGLLWLGLTLGFEFSFGYWVQRHSWEELLQAYTFRDGNIWPLVLLVILLAPSIAQHVRYRRRRPLS